MKKLLFLMLLLLPSIDSYAYDFEVDGLFYNKLSENEVELTYQDFMGGTFSGEITIPEKVIYNNVEYCVTAIGDRAFYECHNITGSLNLPNSIKSIGDLAFKNCSGLTGPLKIPNVVTTIGYSAFSGCSGLTGELRIPDSVTSIGTSAFHSCTGLSGSLSIPSSLKEIAIGLFENCSGLSGTLNIPNSVTTIGNSAFKDCSGFTGSLTIPNSVTTIGENAFSRCTGFSGMLTISDSVSKIQYLAFLGCSGFTTLFLPSSVKSIGEYAFEYCRGLERVISEITTPFSIKTNVFYGISSNAQLYVPDGTKSKYENISAWVEHFKEIIETGDDCNLTINSSGNGYASYNGQIVRAKTSSFVIDRGSSPEIIFVPDNGYRVGGVHVNNENVTSNVYNNRLVLGNVLTNTTIAVVFEAIPSTTYSLSIKATGNGSVIYNDITLRNQSQAFTVNEGSYATISISPESGYRIKSVVVDDKDVTSDISNNLYTISSIKKNTAVEVEFEAIPITTYTLTVTATGNGDAMLGATSITNKTQQFTINEGTSVMVIFSPDNGNSIGTVKVNGVDVTAEAGSRYSIESMAANTMIEVAFVEDINALTVDGLNYIVISQSDKTIKMTGGNIGQVLIVPASVTQNGATWTVTEIDNNALKNNAELAAIIWNPAIAFTATVSNPNILLYVTADQYAPATIKNVIVNGVASDIILDDAANGNDFYCPQTFTAQKISYSHHYGMETGIGTSKGWETIALPFDVQTISHKTKGGIVPFAKWSEGDAAKPFWLYELTGSGFTEADGIKAYTPYIISMPNNPKYDEEWKLNGEITFSAYNVTIEPTNDLKTASFLERTFLPNFTDKAANDGFYGLNVVNDYSSNNSGMTDGSKFVLNMRQIHPFEAYMTTTSNSSRAIGIFDDMTTAIHEIETKMEAEQDAVFDLQGRKLNVPKKGVYIKNGKKYIKK